MPHPSLLPSLSTIPHCPSSIEGILAAEQALALLPGFLTPQWSPTLKAPLPPLKTVQVDSFYYTQFDHLTLEVIHYYQVEPRCPILLLV